MARNYVLKRRARKLDRVRVIYLTRRRFAEKELRKVAPMVSDAQLKYAWVTTDDDEPWEDAINRTIRNAAATAIQQGIGPQKLIIHIVDYQLPIRLRAWLYRYETTDSEEAPFFVKIVTHEKMDEWVITGRTNL